MMKSAAAKNNMGVVPAYCPGVASGAAPASARAARVSTKSARRRALELYLDSTKDEKRAFMGTSIYMQTFVDYYLVNCI